MKRVVISVLLLFSSGSMVFADCFYQEIDPVCSISGETYTNSCAGWSDTSSWSLPKAYDGTCEQVPVLKIAEKEIIGDKMVSIFKKRGYLKTSDGDAHTLTTKGQEFAQDVFFSAVAKYIAREMDKTEPNKRTISVLNYAVSTIGYDYFMDTAVRGDDYAGLSLADAQVLATKNGTTLRVVRQDGEDFAVTMDYRPGRINAEVKNGIVVDYSVE